MLFLSYWFYLFAITVILVYWFIPSTNARLCFLLVASVIFQYHFAGLLGTLITIILAIMVYYVGLSGNRSLNTLAMIVCAGALVFFKYTHFFTLSILSPLSPSWGNVAESLALSWVPAVPPLAISFFTFEFIHYLYDIRGKAQPIRHPLDFALFIFFFPTLVAGPIKRFEQFVPQLTVKPPRFVLDDFAYGVLRVATGFLKKVLFADNMTAYIQFYDLHPEQITFENRWLIFLLLGLRIYLDFSGYSDIAIGVARILGFRLPENFNWPYMATNLQDFWHRWHISLSSWIRDYIYIPLGGSRHGLVRRGFNVFFAFALCGLWHGPHWNFVLWGIMHGVGLSTVVLFGKIPFVGPAVEKILARLPLLSWALTMTFVFFSWILFFYPVDQAWHFVCMLFNYTQK